LYHHHHHHQHQHHHQHHHHHHQIVQIYNHQITCLGSEMLGETLSSLQPFVALATTVWLEGTPSTLQLSLSHCFGSCMLLKNATSAVTTPFP